ncbi:hypothetical protein CHLRE_09g387600v5 [Chlamydomonas reinhardtii]|uniref:Uncharacterized protein n=1 Tax=Chlamydomonas reinhardtii TaxID=3055 RepID=A0A2K3DDQ5_CHLRE|nr:uncharacterized protein CHLRE_09g387600v5 [Chlamydomonas reinhardtii]PNW78668.1 hypothetical protein CHLRE_09g387600v5 [Chlamydomonas reinhardtii]
MEEPTQDSFADDAPVVGKRRSSLGALAKMKPVGKLKAMFEDKGIAKQRQKDSSILAKLKPVSASHDVSSFSAAVADTAFNGPHTISIPAPSDQAPSTPTQPLFALLPAAHGTLVEDGRNESLGSEMDAKATKSPSSGNFFKRSFSGLKKALTPKSSSGKHKHGAASPGYAGSETGGLSPSPSGLLPFVSRQPSSSSMDLNVRSDQAAPLQPALRSPTPSVSCDAQTALEEQEWTAERSREGSIEVQSEMKAARPPRPPLSPRVSPSGSILDGMAARVTVSPHARSPSVAATSMADPATPCAGQLDTPSAAPSPLAAEASPSPEEEDSAVASLSASPTIPDGPSSDTHMAALAEAAAAAGATPLPFGLAAAEAASEAGAADEDTVPANGCELVFPSLGTDAGASSPGGMSSLPHSSGGASDAMATAMLMACDQPVPAARSSSARGLHLDVDAATAETVAIGEDASADTITPTGTTIPAVEACIDGLTPVCDSSVLASAGAVAVGTAASETAAYTTAVEDAEMAAAEPTTAEAAAEVAEVLAEVETVQLYEPTAACEAAANDMEMDEVVLAAPAAVEAAAEPAACSSPPPADSVPAAVAAVPQVAPVAASIELSEPAAEVAACPAAGLPQEPIKAAAAPPLVVEPRPVAAEQPACPAALSAAADEEMMDCGDAATGLAEPQVAALELPAASKPSSAAVMPTTSQPTAAAAGQPAPAPETVEAAAELPAEPAELAARPAPGVTEEDTDEASAQEPVPIAEAAEEPAQEQETVEASPAFEPAAAETAAVAVLETTAEAVAEPLAVPAAETAVEPAPITTAATEAPPTACFDVDMDDVEAFEFEPLEDATQQFSPAQQAAAMAASEVAVVAIAEAAEMLPVILEDSAPAVELAASAAAEEAAEVAVAENEPVVGAASVRSEPAADDFVPTSTAGLEAEVAEVVEVPATAVEVPGADEPAAAEPAAAEVAADAAAAEEPTTNADRANADVDMMDTEAVSGPAAIEAVESETTTVAAPAAALQEAMAAEFVAVQSEVAEAVAEPVAELQQPDQPVGEVDCVPAVVEVPAELEAAAPTVAEPEVQPEVQLGMQPGTISEPQPAATAAEAATENGTAAAVASPVQQQRPSMPEDDPMMVSPMLARLSLAPPPAFVSAPEDAGAAGDAVGTPVSAARSTPGMPTPISPETATVGVRAFQLDDLEAEAEQAVAEGAASSGAAEVDGPMAAQAEAEEAQPVAADEAVMDVPEPVAEMPAADLAVAVEVTAEVAAVELEVVEEAAAPAAELDVPMADSLEDLESEWGNGDLLDGGDLPLPQAVSSPVSTGKSKEKDASASTPGVPSSRKVAPDVTLMVNRESLDLVSLRASMVNRGGLGESLMAESLDSFEHGLSMGGGVNTSSSMSLAKSRHVFPFFPMAPVTEAGEGEQEGDMPSPAANCATGGFNFDVPAVATATAAASPASPALSFAPPPAAAATPDAIPTPGMQPTGASGAFAMTPLGRTPGVPTRAGVAATPVAAASGSQVKPGSAKPTTAAGGKPTATPSSALKALAAASAGTAGAKAAPLAKRPTPAIGGKLVATPGQVPGAGTATPTVGRTPSYTSLHTSTPGAAVPAAAATARTPVPTPGVAPSAANAVHVKTPGLSPLPASNMPAAARARATPLAAAGAAGVQAVPVAGRSVGMGTNLFDTPVMMRATAAPLADSPFPDFDLDTMDISAEASRAAAMLGPAHQAATPVPSGAGRTASSTAPTVAGTPTTSVLEVHVQMLTNKLAEAEANNQRLQDENNMLRDQLSTLQFQSNMTGDLDMEREARQFLEQELSVVRHRMDSLEADLRAAQAEAKRREQVAADTATAHQAEAAAWAQHDAEARLSLQQKDEKMKAMQVEVDAARGIVEQAEARVAEANNKAAAAQAKSEEESGKLKDLQATLGVQAHQLVQAQRARDEAEARFTKAMDQLINAQTAHKKQVVEYEHKLQSLNTVLQQATELRDRYNKLKQAAIEFETRAKTAEAKAQENAAALATAQTEKGELLRMCNELLTQLEASKAKR